MKKSFIVKVRWDTEGDFYSEGETLEDAERNLLQKINDPKSIVPAPLAIGGVANTMRIMIGEGYESDIKNPDPIVQINNHICPTCGNTRVSKSETICWKCGSKLQ